MKYCRQCDARYSDDTLKFCLQDGSTLEDDFGHQSETATIAFQDVRNESVQDQKTEKFSSIGATEHFTTNKDAPEVRAEIPRPSAQHWGKSQETIVAPIRQTNSSNTLVAILATAIVMLLIFGSGGVFVYYYFSDQLNTSNEPTSQSEKSSSGSGNEPNSVNPSPSKKPTENVKMGDKSPEPVVDSEKIKSEVLSTINSWKSASEAFNLEAHMSNYADSVDYYNKKNVNKNVVRADRKKAYDKFTRIAFSMTDFNITLDSNGENATAVFDKAWVFERDEKDSKGKVRSQLTHSRIDGSWKITGEKDLKVYYVK